MLTVGSDRAKLGAGVAGAVDVSLVFDLDLAAATVASQGDNRQFTGSLVARNAGADVNQCTHAALMMIS